MKNVFNTVFAFSAIALAAGQCPTDSISSGPSVTQFDGTTCGASTGRTRASGFVSVEYCRDNCVADPTCQAVSTIWGNRGRPGRCNYYEGCTSYSASARSTLFVVDRAGGACTYCPEGQVPAADGSECQACEPGTAESVAGTCVACEEGTYQSASGATSCEVCECANMQWMDGCDAVTGPTCRSRTIGTPTMNFKSPQGSLRISYKQNVRADNCDIHANVEYDSPQTDSLGKVWFKITRSNPDLEPLVFPLANGMGRTILVGTSDEMPTGSGNAQLQLYRYEGVNTVLNRTPQVDADGWVEVSEAVQVSDECGPETTNPGHGEEKDNNGNGPPHKKIKHHKKKKLHHKKKKHHLRM